ncbi:MAG: response regulator [Acidobacteria bacterium]|nr:response regulator [Acidobacteriota bacterium]
MNKPGNVIAVIDDNALVLDGTRNLLSSAGYDAELYPSADAFLAALPTTQAKCLIVDIQLGDSSGIDLVHQLAEAGFRLPTIFVTASPDATTRRRVEEAGCIVFLRKPICAKLLLEALKESLR